ATRRRLRAALRAWRRAAGRRVGRAVVGAVRLELRAGEAAARLSRRGAARGAARGLRRPGRALPAGRPPRPAAHLPARPRHTTGEEEAVAFEELKEKQRRAWGAAPFEKIAERGGEAHDELVAAVAPDPGERWLDVATGTGAVALRAARAGADV